MRMKIRRIYTVIVDIYEFSREFFLETFAIFRVFHIFPNFSKIFLN